MKNKKKSALIILFAEAFLFAGYFVFSKFKSKKYLNDNFTESQERQSDIQSDKGEIEQRDLIQPEKDKFEIVAQDLIIPWEIVFLPENEGVLVTERAGNLIKIGQDGFSIKVEGVEHYGEGGLLGMTLHPDFEKNRWLYLYYSTNSSGETKNKVVRYIFEGGVLTESQGIISDIPGAIYHDGGRIVFGVDGFLYITTGDATKENLAQDVNSLAGKILRIKDNGDIPADNPFNNAVWSYGHRNSQGLAWDNKGRLWATEHGRSGALSGFDELNLIEKGKNYGWPIIQGDETQEGMVVPVVHSGSSKTWAPGGMVFYDGRLFFTGLRGDALYEFAIDNEDVSLKEHFKEQFGRLRTVSLGPDGLLYVATSNRDGRGSPNVSDDKIIKINHSFNE